MKIGKFEIQINDEKITQIAEQILNEKTLNVQQVCEQYGENKEDVRKYDVYIIDTASGSRILKRTGAREIINYERYLKNKYLPVPQYYGGFKDKEENWLLIENIIGHDLRDMTDELAVLSAKSLSEIQNTYWVNDISLAKDNDRFDAYWERINKRFKYIEKEPIIGKAYSVFLKRQLSCPVTLSNGDFLEFNAICREGKVFIIDWGFGGIMPYSLDIARFIAHATEDKATFPFYMTKKQKELFINGVYDKLNTKPEYKEYLYDIKLAVLNEYVEFIEADEDEDGWYYEHALRLASSILAE
ncbi:MAG: phosphotransferase [Acutalibacteraceae bacterium]